MADILQMHDLKPAPGAKRDRIRVGRGEGSKGKTSGRGDKGTKKRYQVRPGFEGGQLPLYMRLPKLRGFKSPFKKEYQVVNVAALAELFPQGGEITVADLVAKGAVRKGQPVKVLGDGEISVAFTIKGVKASASAKAKIEAAGGTFAVECCQGVSVRLVYLSVDSPTFLWEKPHSFRGPVPGHEKNKKQTKGGKIHISVDAVR